MLYGRSSQLLSSGAHCDKNRLTAITTDWVETGQAADIIKCKWRQPSVDMFGSTICVDYNDLRCFFCTTLQAAASRFLCPDQNQNVSKQP